MERRRRKEKGVFFEEASSHQVTRWQAETTRQPKVGLPRSCNNWSPRFCTFSTAAHRCIQFHVVDITLGTTRISCKKCAKQRALVTTYAYVGLSCERTRRSRALSFGVKITAKSEGHRQSGALSSPPILARLTLIGELFPRSTIR